jgi:hypothetical protein
MVANKSEKKVKSCESVVDIKIFSGYVEYNRERRELCPFLADLDRKRMRKG